MRDVRRGKQAADRLALAITIGIVFSVVVSFHDARIEDRNRDRDITCLANLHRIEKRVVDYEKQHQCEPPNLAAVFTGPDTGSSLLKCPFSRRVPGYVCDFSGIPGNKNVVCWDRDSHHHDRLMFGKQWSDTRCILYKDGHVKMLRESDFEMLGLRGD